MKRWMWCLGVTGWREGLSHEAKHVPRPPIANSDAIRTRVLNDPRVLAAIAAEAERTGKSQAYFVGRAKVGGISRRPWWRQAG